VSLAHFLSTMPREAQEHMSRAAMIWAASRHNDEDALFLIECANETFETVQPITLEEVRRFSGEFPFAQMEA